MPDIESTVVTKGAFTASLTLHNKTEPKEISVVALSKEDAEKAKEVIDTLIIEQKEEKKDK